MQKKLMAVAVAGALAVPAVALAQTSTVQIGGSLTVFYYSHDPNNPSTGQRGDIMEVSEPELFVRGEEALGGGLSVWFQCTSSVDAFVNGAASALGWCGRNSGIGFKGGWGNGFMGNWDQPQKLVFNRARGWWGGTNAFTGGSAVLLNGGSASGTDNPRTTSAILVTTGGVGVSLATTNSASTFFRRQARSWNYHSPVWSGFQFQGAFSSGTESTGNPETSFVDQRMWSVAGHYTNGPLYLGVGYERHKDYNPGNVAPGAGASAYAGGSDDNWTLVAGYTFGPVNVRGMYSRSKYDVTNTTDLKVDGWGLFADWNIGGPHTLRGQYVTVDDTEGSSGVNVGSYKGPALTSCGPTSVMSCATSTGAKVWGLAYSYAFSKRTMGSIVYSKMDNDANASFSKGKTNATAGNSQNTAGIMIQHRF
jgi:predicted porin